MSAPHWLALLGLFVLPACNRDKDDTDTEDTEDDTEDREDTGTPPRITDVTALRPSYKPEKR